MPTPSSPSDCSRREFMGLLLPTVGAGVLLPSSAFAKADPPLDVVHWVPIIETPVPANTVAAYQELCDAIHRPVKFNAWVTKPPDALSVAIERSGKLARRFGKEMLRWSRLTCDQSSDAPSVNECGDRIDQFTEDLVNCFIEAGLAKAEEQSAIGFLARAVPEHLARHGIFAIPQLMEVVVTREPGAVLVAPCLEFCRIDTCAALSLRPWGLEGEIAHVTLGRSLPGCTSFFADQMNGCSYFNAVAVFAGTVSRAQLTSDLAGGVSADRISLIVPQLVPVITRVSTIVDGWKLAAWELERDLARSPQQRAGLFERVIEHEREHVVRRLTQPAAQSESPCTYGQWLARATNHAMDIEVSALLGELMRVADPRASLRNIFSDACAEVNTVNPSAAGSVYAAQAVATMLTNIVAKDPGPWGVTLSSKSRILPDVQVASQLNRLAQYPKELSALAETLRDRWLGKL